MNVVQVKLNSATAIKSTAALIHVLNYTKFCCITNKH